MSVFLTILGLMSMILAVGSIDGPTPETSGDNFLLCFILTVVGIIFFILALKIQLENQMKGNQ
jgi:hypothetical protein|tara:strand:- start:300 stop:488 length:189 start_codon:yes stop_codon:yes gene_type:complete